MQLVRHSPLTVEVLEFTPASLERRLDAVFAECASERHGCSLIEQDSQTASRRGGQASTRMLEDRVDLIAGYAREPLQKLSDCRAAFEILEKRTRRNSRGAEQPFTAELSGHSFDNRTLAPVEHG
jgi:hypothetical protein